MSGVNFTANGTRWHALPITADTLSVPAVSGTGVLFTSADGQVLFLALNAEGVPTLEQLRNTKIVDLEKMMDAAKARPR